MALRIQHCKKSMEFLIDFGAGKAAKLCYQELPGRILDFVHTETPPDQQRKGMARMLVKATRSVTKQLKREAFASSKEGFKYAAENNFKVRPTCPYVAKYVNEMATEDERKLSTTYKQE